MILYKKNPKPHLPDEKLLLEVEPAISLKTRLIGLLKYSSMSLSQGMWFPNVWSIHTFFMRFPIDCIYINNSGKIIYIHENVLPFRLSGYFPWLTYGVVEASSGFAKSKQLSVGDILYVGH